MDQNVQRVSPQIDVGAVTLGGLAISKPVLAALSSDNVNHLAAFQSQDIGDRFHVTGEFAAKVPDLLQRCRSQHLERLILTVGWVKGDCASQMSRSTGGQSVTLLCFCLVNLYGATEAGKILYDLSKRILTINQAVASIAQLAKVAEITSSKTAALGFGNIQAQHVARIYDTYEKMGKTMPSNFYDTVTSNTMTDFLDGLSRVFCDEDQIIHVSGTHGMGCLVTCCMIMFPQDVSLSVDSFILHQGQRKTILLEVDSSKESYGPCTAHVERALDRTVLDTLELFVAPKEKRNPSSLPGCTYVWEGHVADALHFAFRIFGAECSNVLLLACADFVFQMVSAANKHEPHAFALGPNWVKRTCNTCLSTLRTEPSCKTSTVASAFDQLLQAFRSTVGQKIDECVAQGHDCAIEKGWKQVRRFDAMSCPVRILWVKLGQAINRMAYCMLVDADDDAAIHFRLDRCTGGVFDHQSGISCDYFEFLDISENTHSHMIGRGYSDNIIAGSNGSSTIHLAKILGLWTFAEDGIHYRLRDGQPIVNGRYYDRLESQRAPIRRSEPWEEKSTEIKPTRDAYYSKVDFSVLEDVPFPRLRTRLEVEGHSIQVDLGHCLASSLKVKIARPCEHILDEPLDATLNEDVLIGTLAKPRCTVGSSKIVIVQTHINPIAQLFACDDNKRALLQLESCLTCTVLQAKAEGIRQVIVG